MNRKKEIKMLGFACVLFILIVAVLYNPWRDRNVYTPSDELGDPIEVRKNIWITPEAMKKITNEELEEFHEEYGQEDVNIIIMEIGP